MSDPGLERIVSGFEEFFKSLDIRDIHRAVVRDYEQVVKLEMADPARVQRKWGVIKLSDGYNVSVKGSYGFSTQLSVSNFVFHASWDGFVDDDSYDSGTGKNKVVGACPAIIFVMDKIGNVCARLFIESDKVNVLEFLRNNLRFEKRATVGNPVETDPAIDNLHSVFRNLFRRYGIDSDLNMSTETYEQQVSFGNGSSRIFVRRIGVIDLGPRCVVIKKNDGSPKIYAKKIIFHAGWNGVVDEHRHGDPFDPDSKIVGACPAVIKILDVIFDPLVTLSPPTETAGIVQLLESSLSFSKLDGVAFQSGETVAQENKTSNSSSPVKTDLLHGDIVHQIERILDNMGNMERRIGVLENVLFRMNFSGR